MNTAWKTSQQIRLRISKNKFSMTTLFERSFDEIIYFQIGTFQKHVINIQVKIPNCLH